MLCHLISYGYDQHDPELLRMIKHDPEVNDQAFYDLLFGIGTQKELEM